jgi:hypothetical protein
MLQPLVTKLSQHLLRKKFYDLMNFYKQHLNQCLFISETLMLPVHLLNIAFNYKFNLIYSPDSEPMCIFPPEMEEAEIEDLNE